jgi:hypothetical protein
VFEGIETFSGLVPRYALFERLYLRAGFPLQDNLEEALVKLYATALKYLIKANKYYAEGSISKSSVHSTKVLLFVPRVTHFLGETNRENYKGHYPGLWV